MYEPILLPMVTKLKVVQVLVLGYEVRVVMAATASAARCPECQQLSRQVHSQYVRHLADQPWGRVPVRIELHTRRFFCRTAGCVRQVFTERLPELTQPYGRRTHALEEALCWLGWTAGGEAGARLAERLRFCGSADSLLRVIRRSGVPELPEAHVVGVDDFAFRKGLRYGTLVVDLELQRVIDLLAERSTESWANWLRAHPGVRVVSRDRADVYAAGTRLGAPQAQPVADRWHLMHNLIEHVQRVVERHQSQLRALTPPATHSTMTPAVAPSHLRTVQTRAEQAQSVREQRYRQRYEEVHALHQHGWSIPAVARHTGLDDRTVHKLLQAESFPGLPSFHRPPRAVAGFETLIRQHWDAGLRDVKALLRQVRTQGYTGSYSALRTFVRTFAGASPDALVVPLPQAAATLAPRAATWWLVGQPGRLTQSEHYLLTLWRDACPQLLTTQHLAARFKTLLTGGDVQALHDWLHAAESCQISELQHFAASLRSDLAAVEAAVVYLWNNGQAEGQVNRLKLLKRQMYGRAGFDLLRLRVLNKV